MSQRPKYTITDTLPDLDGGVLIEKISRAFRDACIATAAHGDKGKQGRVTIQFDLARISESESHLHCAHKITTVLPEPKGKTTSENSTETPLYLNRHGIPSVLPETEQDDWVPTVDNQEQ